mgnify:CR=1 FL=1
MAPKSITNDELQNKLLEEFFDSRYFGDQHWFAARAEIEALNARIKELEAKLHGKAEKGSTVKSDKPEE